MRLSTPPSAFGGLLKQYLAGQIEEPLWRSVMVALDAREAGPAEREALVSFVHTAVTQRATEPNRSIISMHDGIVETKSPVAARAATP